MNFNFLNSKKKVLLKAPLLTNSGYGVHSRQIARWLLSLNNEIDSYFNLIPWGNTSWIVDPTYQKNLVEKIINKSVDDNFFADISFQVQLPNEWTNCAKYNVGVTAGVETDLCNPEWLTAINNMNKVVVPSAHTKFCFENSSKHYGIPLTTEILIIPESFPDEILEDKNSEEISSIKLETNFNFLLFGQLTGNNPFNDRKNTFFTIKWFCEEFKNNKDVGLIIKTNVGKYSKSDRDNTTALLKKVVSESKKGNVYPKIYLLHGKMDDFEVSSLYKHEQVKCLLSATRGEGYGLPLLEAAASGLPVIATGWSGHLDFLQKEKFINLDYVLKEIHTSRVDNKIFMKGSKWAEVKEDDFKKKIRKFKNSDLIPRKRSVELKENICKKYCFDSVSKLYSENFRKELFS